MSSRLDQYRHLNPKDGITIDIDTAIAQLDQLNYGVHRALSAIVRCRMEQNPEDELALGIKALLDRGLH